MNRIPLNIRRFLPITMMLLLLSGCAGYRKQLDEYETNRPPSYLQRTLELTNDNPAEEVDNIPDSSADEMRSKLAPKDTFVELAEEFYGIEAAQFNEAQQRFADSEIFASDIGTQVVAHDLLLAVAFRNPSVRAARHRWQATLDQYSQAEYLDSLIAEYRSFTKYLNVESGKPMNKEMSKKFTPWPGMIGLKGELVRQQVHLAEVDWQKTLRDAVVETGNLYYQYQYLNRAEQTTRENVELTQGLLDVVERRYESGKATQADLIKVQTELERQRNMLMDLGAQKLSIAAKINAQLDRSADAPLGVPAEMNLPDSVPTFMELRELAENSRQEVLMQQTKVKRMETAIRLGEVMNRPIASQGYSTFERGMKPDASPDKSNMPYGTMAKTRELPAYAQAEAYLAEMRDKLNAERAQLDHVLAQTRAMAQSTVQELDITLREKHLIDEIVLPQSQSAYEVSLSGYTSGRVNFLDLLDAERALLKARLEAHAAARDWNQASLGVTRVSGRFEGGWENGS